MTTFVTKDQINPCDILKLMEYYDLDVELQMLEDAFSIDLDAKSVGSVELVFQQCHELIVFSRYFRLKKPYPYIMQNIDLCSDFFQVEMLDETSVQMRCCLHYGGGLSVDTLLAYIKLLDDESTKVYYNYLFVIECVD